MKNLVYAFLCVFWSFGVNAQLVNDGASIVIEDGATLFVESDVQNNTVGANVGSIDIQGTGIMEVQGDLTNAGNITMAANSKLIFSGAASTNVTSGGATFSKVEMNKSAGQTISLQDAMIISGDLNFVADDNKVILGANNLTFGTGATITSADNNEYIQADGTGVVSKEMNANGTFKFEIGDAGAYSPLDANISGTGYAAGAKVDVNVVASAHTSIPSQATDYISRYWNVDQTGITGYNNMLTGTYAASDVTGDATKVKGAFYNGMDWTYGTGGTNTVSYTTTGNGDLTGTNSFGKVNLKVFLDGPFTGGAMTSNLNTLGLIPLTSPYSDGVTVTSIPANVVDWIWLETRNDATPSMVEGGSSAFLKSDGSVVGLDGTSNPIIKDANTTGYLVVDHRNHLAVSTAASIALDGSAGLQDFSSPAYSTYGSNGLKNNGGVMTMWPGDANQNSSINYQGANNDSGAIKNGVLGNPGNIFNILSYSYSAYSPLDINLDGNIKYSGSNNDNATIKNTILGHPSNIFGILTFTIYEQTP